MAGDGVVSSEYLNAGEYKKAVERLGIPQSSLAPVKMQLPESVEDVQKAVGQFQRIRIGGSCSYRLELRGKSSGFYPGPDDKLVPIVEVKQHPFDLPNDAKLLLDKLDKVLWFSPENQLVSVQSGILLSELNQYLRENGFEIPIGLQEKNQRECIGDLIALNLPHWNMSAAGSWRDWIVKMKVVLASGEVVTTGADVVKNVTGFDLHKLLIGARHTLGVVTEVTLRVRPKAEPREWPPIQINHGVMFLTSKTGLAAVLDHIKDFVEESEDSPAMQHYVDFESGLILAECLRNKSGEDFDTKSHGFVWRSQVGEYALDEFSELEQRLMKRTKEIFDPTYKLNPGEFGFI